MFLWDKLVLVQFWGVLNSVIMMELSIRVAGRMDGRVDAPLHINAKELTVLHIFLEKFLHESPVPRRLLWHADSTTAIAYMANQGGTLSRPLLDLAMSILNFTHNRQVQILPVFVPSAENLLADVVVRFLTLSDWHLHWSAFKSIINHWGLPEIDLFTTEESSHLPRFYTWGDAGGPEAFNALEQVWNFQIAYAFSILALLPRTVRKLVSTGVFVVVTPFWPSQKWWPLLLWLRIVDVR